MEETRKVPKTVGEELALLIQAMSRTFENAGYVKSDPMVALWRDGQMTTGFVLSELPLIQQKRSDLPAGKRAAIVALASAAVRLFDGRRKAKDEVKENQTRENG